MRCLTGARFNMIATVIDYAPVATNVDASLPGGHFETIQDPDTGNITRVWVEDQAVVPSADNAGASRAIPRFDIPCYVRGFTELGFRSSANTEAFDDGTYLMTEVIQMIFPASYSISRRQYVTNIRGRDKKTLWLEEEIGQPTIFEVQGVTPTFDPFGRHIDNIAVLRRSVNQ